MTLKSWKWTWSPVLLIFDTIKTNMFAAHVMLCADYNARCCLGHTDPNYLRPYDCKEFYRMLGLQMMEYTEVGQYWFESDVAKARFRRRRDRSSAATQTSRA